MTGRDYVLRPILVVTAENDIISDENKLMTPVTDAVGINPSRSYGVVPTGANHMTATTQFDGAAVQLQSWNAILQLPNILPSEEATSEEEIEFQDSSTETTITEFWDAIFYGTGLKSAEKERLQVIKDYSRNLFDAYLSAGFDPAGAEAFLGQSANTHEMNAYVKEFGYSPPTRAFFVRDSGGVPLVQFQSDGNVLLLRGDLLTSQSSIATSSASEFVLKSNAGQIIALIDETSGNLKLKSTHVPAYDVQRTSSPEFLIRNETDAGDDVQTRISNTGQMLTRGHLYTDDDL